MGSSQTKEEVVIAQAGNGNAARAEVHPLEDNLQRLEVCGAVLVVAVILGAAYFVYRKCNRCVDRKVLRATASASIKMSALQQGATQGISNPGYAHAV